MEDVIKIYEKIQIKRKIEKLIYITNLTQDFFYNIKKNDILFINGPYKNGCIKSFLDKHFNVSACILPTNIFKIIIESLEYYKQININNNNINNNNNNNNNINNNNNNNNNNNINNNIKKYFKNIICHHT